MYIYLFIYLSVCLFVYCAGQCPLPSRCTFALVFIYFVAFQAEPTFCTAVDFQSVCLLPRLLYYAKVYVTF